MFNQQRSLESIWSTGPGVRITGLRIKGPDQKFHGYELIEVLNNHPELTWNGKGYKSFPIGQGIMGSHPGLEVDNCELFGWSHAAIGSGPEAKGTHIHHNYIHHCHRAGLGYGVCLDGSDALIEANRFDNTRHAIAGTGVPGTAYEARNNWHGPNIKGHNFDMHGSHEWALQRQQAVT